MQTPDAFSLNDRMSSKLLMTPVQGFVLTVTASRSHCFDSCFYIYTIDVDHAGLSA